MFAQLSSTSQKCKHELTNEVSRLGGTAAEGTLTIGKFFRVWMDVKAALPSQRSLQERGKSEAGTPRTMKPNRE